MDPTKAELMRALGRLVRGLSILFWGIPLVLAADVETARTNWLDSLGALSFVPVLILSGLLWYGLRRLRDFQRQERVWQQALDRADIFAIVNTGLAPFLFLIQLNQVLRRLTAMLPDETLRMEARTFAKMNTWMLLAALGSLSLYLALTNFQGAVHPIGRHLIDLPAIGEWLVLFLTLMPIAVTLALVWKIKEAIFTSFFEVER